MKPKVLVIVGPTASGKTSLSVKIAEQFSGEVISADSRQVYRGIDLCSGKVTTEEMYGVPHHLLDVADPMATYTVKDFAEAATAAILDIQNRSRLPIVAGGTFLYTDTLLGKISVPSVPPNEALRTVLESRSVEALFAELQSIDPVRAAAIDKSNPRRLVRAIEVATALGSVPLRNVREPYDVLTLGIDLDQETLHHNIHVRLEERLKADMLEEVETLLASGVTHDRLESLGLECRYLSRYLHGEMSYEAAMTELETKIRQFAKRQKTWLKRDDKIVWVQKNDLENIHQIVAAWLAA
jgi:tRNA dimethylallyltransferase